MGIFGDDGYNGKKGWDGMYGDVSSRTAKAPTTFLATTTPAVSLGYTPGEDRTPGAPDTVLVVKGAPESSAKLASAGATTPDSDGAIFLYNTTKDPDGVLVKAAKGAGMIAEGTTGAVTKTATALVDAGFGATAATLNASANALGAAGDVVRDTVAVPYDLVKEIGSYNSAQTSPSRSLPAARANYWEPVSVRMDTEEYASPFDASFDTGGLLAHLNSSLNKPAPVYTANSARRIIANGGYPVYSAPVKIDSETLVVERSGKPGSSFDVSIGVSGDELIRCIARLVKENSRSPMTTGAARELACLFAPYAWIGARGTEIMCQQDSDSVTVDGLLSREQIGWLQDSQFSNGERVLFTGTPPCNGTPVVFVNVPYQGYEQKIKPCLEKRTCPIEVARVLSASQTKTTVQSNNDETTFGVRYAIPIKGDTSLGRCIKSALRTKNLRNDYARERRITIKYDKKASTDAIAYFDVTVKSTASSFDEVKFTSMLAKLVAQACDGRNGMGRSISDWDDESECKRMAFKQDLRIRFPRKVTDNDASSRKSTCKLTITHHLALYLPVGVSKGVISVR